MSTTNQDLAKILEFTHYIYSLKTILRFRGMPGWEDGDWDRWDSIAEHSYRMALLGVMLEPYLKVKVDLFKTLKMILVHDIVEIIAKDYNPLAKQGEGGGHAFSHTAFQEKYLRELAAAKIIFKKLPAKFNSEFVSLFREYIDTKGNPELATPEGRFAYALDKIEAAIQVIDWRKTKKNWSKDHFAKSMKYMFEWSDYDPALKQFCQMIQTEGKKIIKK